MAFRTVIARSILTAGAWLVTPCAFAEDAPVEKPSVDQPALPQSAPGNPGGSSAPAQPSGHGSGQSEAPHQARPAHSTAAQPSAQANAGDSHRIFPYLAAGAGVLSGLSGGQDFERTNAALTGMVGLEIPVSRDGSTGLGFELNGDLELAAQVDRGTYTALLLRARLGHLFTPRNRLWGAVGLGGAGYQTGSLAFGLAAGTSLMLVPKFGLDLSANLNLLGASSANNAGVQYDYSGGAVLLIAIRALFELHR